MSGLGRATFSSLRTRNYRLFFTGQLVSVSGTWMESVAQSFLVLQLTGSGTQLGFVTAARFGPMFLLGPWGGLIADRVDRHRLLMVTQVLSGCVSLLFSVLVGTHSITMPLVYVLSVCLGCVNVLDNPARQTLIPDLVPQAQLVNAVTLNSVMMNVARVVGAAFGGVVAAAVGIAWCFGVNAASFGAVVISLALMRRSEIATHVRAGREPGQVRAGLRYVARTPDLLVPLTMLAVLGTLTWEFPVSLPLLARNTFGGDAATYGAMSAMMGIGGVIGGLVSASRARRSLSALTFAGLGWGAAITVAGLAPSLPVEYVVLLFVGYGSITFNSLAKTTLQLRAAPAMRGRVMALWAIAWQGSTPIGGPIIGTVSEHVGARSGVLVGGIAAVVVSAAAWPRLRRAERHGGESVVEPAEDPAPAPQ